MGRRVLRFDGAFGPEGCGLPLCGNVYKVSVTGLAFCIIWHEKHSADWLAALPPFGGCATTFPPQAGALQPVLNLESLMKKLPHGALFCHRLRGKSREAGKGGKPR